MSNGSNSDLVIKIRVKMLERLSDMQKKIVRDNFEIDNFEINKMDETVLTTPYIEREENNNVQCVQQ